MTGANRSRTAALLAGGIVVVATAVIVIFGFVPTPKYPLLAEEPDPELSGMIAYAIPEDSDRDDEFGSRCVYVIELPEGQTNEITCREQIGWGMAWTDDGWLVVESFGHVDEFEREFDDFGLALLEPIEGGAFEGVKYEGDPRFLRSGEDMLDVSWDASSCPAADYNLLYGDIANIAGYTFSGAECGIGTSGSYAWSSPPGSTLFFLLVGTDGVGTESSWGWTDAWIERAGTAASGFCGVTVKEPSNVCD